MIVPCHCLYPFDGYRCLVKNVGKCTVLGTKGTGYRAHDIHADDGPTSLDSLTDSITELDDRV